MPLTRITSTKVEPLKETTSKLVNTPNPEIRYTIGKYEDAIFLVLYDSCDLDDYRMSLLVWLEPVVMNPTLAGMRHHHSPTFVYPNIKQLSNKRWAWTANMALSFIQRISLTGFPAQSVGSSNTDVLDLPGLVVLITGTSQSRQHVDTSLIHIESCKSPTAVLFDDDTGRISIRHFNSSRVYLRGTTETVSFREKLEWLGGLRALHHWVMMSYSMSILLSEPPVLLDVKHSYQWSSAMDTELSIEKGFSKHCQPLGHSVLTNYTFCFLNPADSISLRRLYFLQKCFCRSINASGYAALTKLNEAIAFLMFFGLKQPPHGECEHKHFQRSVVVMPPLILPNIGEEGRLSMCVSCGAELSVGEENDLLTRQEEPFH
ncbi:hypothetical protein Tco_0573821 [Tanacetum coccineum]